MSTFKDIVSFLSNHKPSSYWYKLKYIREAIHKDVCIKSHRKIAHFLRYSTRLFNWSCCNKTADLLLTCLTTENYTVFDNMIEAITDKLPKYLLRVDFRLGFINEHSIILDFYKTDDKLWHCNLYQSYVELYSLGESPYSIQTDIDILSFQRGITTNKIAQWIGDDLEYDNILVYRYKYTSTDVSIALEELENDRLQHGYRARLENSRF